MQNTAFPEHTKHSAPGTKTSQATEALSLKLGHLDMENAMIFVQSGNGGKDRMVPMSATLRRWIKEYLDDRKRLRKNGEHVFVSLRGDTPFTYRGLTRMVTRIKKGTDIDFSPHKLRHTFATLMLEGGCDLFSLQQMLGHSDIKTTTIHLSVSANMLRAQMAKHPLG
jgi:site-specific recombinase XerD